MNPEVRSSASLIGGELFVLAILLMLSDWRWGKGVPVTMALLFVLPLAYLLYRGEYLVNYAAIAAVAILIFALVVMFSYRNRLHEQSDTVAAMRRVSAALDQYRGMHRGTYPDGAHFANAVSQYDAGIPLN